jgi:phage-related baseplate assembly protein
LLINAFAYREMLVREKVQYAATQNLVEFASAPFLDYLGQLVGVTRLSASKASVVLEFQIVDGHLGVTIPVGTRVATVDGGATFATIEDVLVEVGVTTIEVTAECVIEGSAGNGFDVGTVTTIIDPQPFLTSVTNTSASNGGADQETDEALRERIKLAPASFSNAGSYGAYKYFAKSANPAIIDVAVIGPPDIDPGEVEIYPLLEDGSETPTSVLDEVDAAVNDEKVRPLTDLVTVIAPTKTDYTIEVNVTILTTADSTAVDDLITSALNDYALERRQALGRDIRVNKIISKCFVDGVYDVEIVSPVSDIIVGKSEYGFCTGVTVNISDTNDG